MTPVSKGEIDDSGKVDENAEQAKFEEDLETLFEYIDEKHVFFIKRLRDFVEFQTIASDPTKKDEFPRMADYMVEILKKFKIQSMVMNMIETEEDDTRVEGDVVPFILAETDIDPSKRTVLFYCHYDVYPTNYFECWTDPFELMMTLDDSELHGKGTSAGKGPFLCIINAIGAYQKKKIPLPVNVKIILDPMGTVEEDVTGKFLRRIDTDFFLNVDFVCLSNGRWLGDTRPCICHGSRGMCHFTVEVEGPSKDLHSGSYGGLFNEPMSDLIYILNSLVDKNGVIRITDIYDDVPPVTKEEKKFFKFVHFSVRDFQQEIGATQLQVNEDKVALLMRLWCQPSLTIHGIQGAFSNPGTKNIIPGKVTGKFSINIVPNMSPSKVKKKVVDYLAKVWKARKSTNKICVQMTVGKLYWYTDPSDMNVIAAKNAVAKVYNTEPDLIRQSKRIRIANVLRKITGASVVKIPIGKSNDVSDVNSEKIDVINYINGCKIYAAYMMYLGKLFPKVKTPDKFECTCRITGQLESCKCYLQFIPPPEEELDERLTDWSLSLISTNMSGDEKPEFRYYHLSMLAMKKMKKLQELISISHEDPMSTQRYEDDEARGQDVRTSIQTKESQMASFPVPALHDQSKPLVGSWIQKPAKATKMEAARFLVHVESGSLRPPESSTKTIPQALQKTESSVAALKPTEFSFKLAQSLKRDKFQKYQVLTVVGSPSLSLADGKNVGASKSLGGVPTMERPSEPSESNKIKNGTLDSRSTSAPDLLGASQKPQGGHSSATVDSKLVSSIPSTLYSQRLDKGNIESTISLKNANPQQIQANGRKTIRHSTDRLSPEKEYADETSSESSVTSTSGKLSGPGGPIKPKHVISSLSQMFYKKRVTNEQRVSDSMKALNSGLLMLSSSTRNVESLVDPGIPSVRPDAGPNANPGSLIASSGASATSSPAEGSTDQALLVQEAVDEMEGEPGTLTQK